MKQKKWIVLGLFMLIGFIFVGRTLSCSHKNQQKTLSTIKVKRGTIVEKALAVGTIEPVSQVAVKSKISGVVKKLFVDEGDSVKKGDPLIKVQPEPTPLELAEAKREVELISIKMKNLKQELTRQEELQRKGLISERDLQTSKSNYRESAIRYKMATEKLALLEKGKIKIENTRIETIIRAPISGSILERKIEIGDPVVPLTSYQAGTALLTLADMSRLIFRGTVDEIDVGKLRQGMGAHIQIGALPNAKIEGTVSKISLRAQTRENATVFPIKITLKPNPKIVLRAGYSANATIIIQERKDVLTLPERVITFRNDSAFVRIKGKDGKPHEKPIRVGLSNALAIEVVSGLKEGDEVFEKPTRTIQ
ncbi:MAG: efflux RND transporter periplasmic adaptor subunit [Calditrichaeota bacterium]|nr:efflux RND transporter periplasmic adaptor subunit [Calditrichota bacterium]